MILYPGFKLGKYTIKEQLGVPGGFGVVYRAVEDFTGRDVAVKEFFEAGDQTELQVLARLNHPNIIQYVTYEIFNNTHFLVMEYAREGNLSDRITRRGCLPEIEALEIFKQLAGALAFAHRQNIVHRDIKPLNVMCCQGNLYKLGDFGIARFMEKSRKSTKGAGSFYYAAPELFRGQFSKKTDVYALGVTFYEMLTGAPPFTGNTDFEVIGKITDEKIKPEIPSGLSALIRNILEATLEKDMNRRWDIEQVVDAIASQGSISNSSQAFQQAVAGRTTAQPTVGRVSPQETGILVVDSSGSGDYRSIQAAVDAARPNQTVVVKAGTYREKITIISKPVNLYGEGRDRTIVEYGNGSVIDVVEVAGGEIKGITFRYMGTKEQPAMWLVRALIKVSDCRATGATLSGIEIKGGSPVIFGNVCERNKKGGIHVYGGAKGTIRNNEIIDNDMFTILVREEGTSPEVVGNKIEGNKVSHCFQWGKKNF